MCEMMRTSSSLTEAKCVASDNVHYVALQSVCAASVRVQSHQKNAIGSSVLLLALCYCPPDVAKQCTYIHNR